MNQKRPKPNLLDPILEQKMIKTLKPPKQDYWEPTKNIFQTFWQDYIIPNIYLVLFIILILVLLLYRYRMIQDEREKIIIQPIISYPNQQGYTDLVLNAYDQQKEILREPKVPTKNFITDNKYSLPQGFPDNKNNKKSNSNIQEPQFAYPIYPFIGGSLAPSGKR